MTHLDIEAYFGRKKIRPPNRYGSMGFQQVTIGNHIVNGQHLLRLCDPHKLLMAFPEVHKQAERHEPHLILRETQMGHAVIQKPGKQFFIAYPAAVFFPSGSLSIFRFVPRYMASMMASL